MNKSDMDTSDYLEVTVSIDPYSEDNADIVAAMLSDLPYDSFVYETGVVKCYIQKKDFDRQALKAVLHCLDFKTGYSVAAVPFHNWNNSWEQEFKPVVVDGKVTIRRADDGSVRRTRFNIKLRPEMAFGTGHHDTTYMMMSAMLANEPMIRGNVVMDMGCGTAVLAILAAKMGALKVYGIDIDAVAAQSAFDNARLNRVGRKVETYCGDASLLQMGKYNVLLANIHRNIIIEDLRTYARSVKKGGLILLSGFYESDVEDIMAEAELHGLSLRSSAALGGWACLVLCK